jgi:phosphoribosylformimino-5-aminoimidazole carboxamide ribotide isomerase
MKIIPAIDIIDGKCVRLTKGDYNSKKIYHESPLEVAKLYENHGIKYLHLVDLDGAKENKIINYKILEEISLKTKLVIDFGGGIKTDEDVNIALNSGANQITVGSIAATKPALFYKWIEKYGAKNFILGADCKDRKIKTNGWLKDSGIEIDDLLESFKNSGIKEVISTDISKDGMLAGPAFDLYRELLEKFSFDIIASGGVHLIDDLIKLKKIGCSGAIIGKALYENTISLKELEELC